MDPAAVAAGAIALLRPLLNRVGDEFAGEAGRAVAAKAEGLLRKLREAFSGDRRSKDEVTAFERDPDGMAETFALALARRLAEDEELRRQVVALLGEARQAGPHVRVVQKMAEAEAVVGLEARRMRRGQADVEQEIEKANWITGAKFDEIG